ncbi:Cadherin-10 T2-cadherin [Triplophysa tibetana]|uniref:Cadherin-6 n=1 Tax=Triplophysa tibetana TaxID=1572043 RepID=A0A5A9P9Z5_9TELE|nr:Cadherin-10 T2-cadherin [Triplophysa tibetana]
MIMNHFLWLLPLIFPHLSSPVILLERSDGNLLLNWNHMMEEDKTVLHRFRRDWMWRQFFLSEEYTGSNNQYVGKLRSDKDSGDGTARYVLSGEGAGTVFRIDEKSGDLHATQRLDREEKASYTLQAQAFNKITGLPLEPATEFIVKIHDINDNEPKFTQAVYSASVPEMSDVGIVRIALSNMDREVRNEYQVVIQAKDMAGQMGGLSGTAIVNVTLTDVNDSPPRFAYSSYHLSTYESADIGSTVGRIKANDGDEGENADMKYKILDGDGKEYLDIITDDITQEGVIVVKKKLDYESKRVYTVKVEVSNSHQDPNFLHLGPFSDTAIIKVAAKDVDEPPIFSRVQYAFEVNEDTPKGTAIGTITAWDPDATDYPILYAIDQHSDPERLYHINPKNGSITILRSLDREVSKWHNLSILASEMNNPHQRSRVPVLIKVLDVNDNAPEFAMIYETFVCENVKAGQLIQTISAIDTDEPLVGHKFVFSLSSPNTNFTIFDNEDNTARILTRRSGFNRREMSVYYLPVVISDSDYPIQSSTSTLMIRVCSCDATGNMRSCSVDALLLSAGLSTGALVAILLCILILLMIVVLFSALKKQRRKEPLIISKEDVRDNVVSYNDEGGGEEDTQAFDIGTLRHPEVIESNKLRRDIIPEMLFPYHRPSPMKECADVRDFIISRLQENDTDPFAPPYDSLATYAYEGNGSIAESLSSLESSAAEGDHEYDYLYNWGPQFKKLADMYIGKDTGVAN